MSYSDYLNLLDSIIGAHRIGMWQWLSILSTFVLFSLLFFARKNGKHKASCYFAIIIIILSIFFYSMWLVTYSYNLPLGPSLELEVSHLTAFYTFYMPIIMKGKMANVGVTTENNMSSVGRYYNPNTSLKISVRGADTITAPLAYDWSKVDDLLGGYRPTWIVVTNAPEWMAEDRIICKLPRESYWGQYATFIQEVIDRYDPKYLELWNEPDVEQSQMPTEHYRLYGCVGDGEKYAHFVDYIYDHVQGAEIIIGSVASVYDPFISEMMMVSPPHDGLSFHCYPRMYGVVFGDCRADYAQAELWTDRPVYLSETAILYRSGLESVYEAAQITHFYQIKQLTTISHWYSLANNGWPPEMPTDFVCRGIPRPVHYHYRSQ